MLNVNGIRVYNYTTTNFDTGFEMGVKYDLVLNADFGMTQCVGWKNTTNSSSFVREQLLTPPAPPFSTVQTTDFMTTPWTNGDNLKCLGIYAQGILGGTAVYTEGNCTTAATPGQCGLTIKTCYKPNPLYPGEICNYTGHKLWEGTSGAYLNGFPPLPADGSMLPVMQFGAAS